MFLPQTGICDSVDAEWESEVRACSSADGMDWDSKCCFSRGKALPANDKHCLICPNSSPKSLPGLWISSEHSVCSNT